MDVQSLDTLINTSLNNEYQNLCINYNVYIQRIVQAESYLYIIRTQKHTFFLDAASMLTNNCNRST